jgi:hypothetical protein
MPFKGDFMSPRTLVFLSVISIPILAAAGPITLKNASGTVEIKPAADAVWSQARPGTAVPSGAEVRTGVDGRAELRFANKASVWMKPSTKVALEQQGARRNRIVMMVGSLKIRVPHLGFRDKFEIRTPTAVASVRGTVFSASADEISQGFQTFFGQVDVKTDDGRSFKVPQGMGFDGKSSSLLSRMQEMAGLEDWAPGLSDDQRRRDLESFVKNRQEIRDFASDALARNNEIVQSLAAKVKEDDFAAGRTLTDVHGNLVRVEQRLDRPDAATIEVLNITMRTTYNFGGVHHFSYHGPSGSRIDALIAKAEFNTALPDKINDFPSFFSSRGDSVKIDHASLILANMSDPDNIATVAYLGDRQSLTTQGASDDISADLYVGSLGTLGNVKARDRLFGLTKSNAVAVNGLSQYTTDPADSINSPASTNGELYGWGAKRFALLAPGASGPSDAHIWICTDNYVINNGGGIRNVADYTGGGANVADLLGNSAAESVVFVKKDIVGPRPTYDATDSISADLLGGKNIDLVVLPDLFYSVMKTLATSVDKFNTTHN